MVAGRVLREPLEGGAFERHESGEDGKGKKGRGVEKPKTFMEGSIKCAAMIDQTDFVSGTTQGTSSFLDVLTGAR